MKGGYILKRRVIKALVSASMYTAKVATNSASFWGLYQPKEPRKFKIDKSKIV